MTYRHSKPLLITLSLISLVLLAILTLGIYKIRFTNKETSTLLNLVDESSNKEILSQSIKIVQNTAAGDIKAFNDLVLTDDKLVLLIEKIEKSGRALGLDTSILSVEKIEDTRNHGLSKIRMVIETKGAWAPILSFLYLIENLPQRVLIEESDLSKQGDDWHSKIVLSLYSSN